jgi:hypothetical protein
VLQSFVILLALVALHVRVEQLPLPGEVECTCCHRQMKIAAQHFGAEKHAGVEHHSHSCRALDLG